MDIDSPPQLDPSKEILDYILVHFNLYKYIYPTPLVIYYLINICYYLSIKLIDKIGREKL